METPQKRHQALKTKFNTMLFQIIGNKALVELFVRFPLLTAEQPGNVLSDITRVLGLEELKKHGAPIHSKASPSGTVRLSSQIYFLQQLEKNGRCIHEWIRQDRNNWYKLTDDQRKQWESYMQHKDISQEIQDLREMQTPRFAGAAESVA